MKPSLLSALFLITVPLLGQQQPGAVSGKVVNSVTGQPVKKAVVYLRTADGAKSYVTGSDAYGKFAFDNIQPASYVVTGQAEGYANFQRNSGKPVAVSAQQTVEDVEVRIAPLSVITGKVVDEDGQPVPHVNIRAMHYQYSAQGKRLQLTANGQTDDRGVYRMSDVQPGRYYLRAFAFAGGTERGANTHSTIPEEAYETNYYPGVAEISQAPATELQPGAELTADFKLRRLPAYHIRGHVAGVPMNGGRGGNNVNVMVQHCDEESGMSFMPDGLQMTQEPNGRFDAFGAMDGTYCVTVMPNISARKTVTVKGANVDGIEIAAEPMFAVTGTVVVDGTAPNPMPPLNIGLMPDNTMGQLRGMVKSDGTFRLDGAFPGPYSVAMFQGGALYVKSILFGGQDVTNGRINLQPETALTITMGTDPGEIDGSVQTGSLDSGTPVTIAALPEDAFAARQDMYCTTAAPAGSGFSLRSVPPGNYKVFALQTEGGDDVYNRELTKLLEGKATAVTVHAAGHEQISVTAISSGEIEQALKKLK